MPIISQTTRTARKHYWCDDPRDGCEGIEPGERYARLYGVTEKGDPPYVMRVCAACLNWYLTNVPNTDLKPLTPAPKEA